MATGCLGTLKYGLDMIDIFLQLNETCPDGHNTQLCRRKEEPSSSCIRFQVIGYCEKGKRSVIEISAANKHKKQYNTVRE